MHPYRKIRDAVNERLNAPVEIIPGDMAPVSTGEGCHYENKSGDWISYPSAYSAKGWSSMVYCPSTISIKVGIKWVMKHSPEAIFHHADNHPLFIADLPRYTKKLKIRKNSNLYKKLLAHYAARRMS